MIYRRFGRTGLSMPVFSCGGMRYQQSWERGARVSGASQENVAATIARALELGIDHIETARGYGTSEVQLRPVLARVPRASFKLQTKIRPLDSARQFERQLEESLAGLGVEHLDLFAFHGVNTPRCLERIFASGGCLEVVERWRRGGRIHHVGFSTHGHTEIVRQAVETGAFDYLNLHYYYLFQDHRPVLEAARRRDMGVFIISPTDKGGRLQKPPARLRTLCGPLSPLVFNHLWCLAHPEIHTLSIGPSRPEQFTEHLAALPLLEEAERRSPEDPAVGLRPLLAPIVARLEAAYAEAVGADFARGWQEGLREWFDMPGRINVRRILWLYNLARAYDLTDFAQERYAAMAPDDHWVPGAHAVDFEDAAITAALPDSPFRHEIPTLLRQAHAALHNPAVEGLP